ncbi:hypothetical protein [Pseudomonas sp. B14(2017)]|uniref:hypothetical protein n=1 Tax=Pseudomonas sp. B14(2017) TaxID=1981745 RepID=UPI000A1E1624|nr:hypothetical protein [Pseudomonas sp. B14(2017)]
MFIIKFYRAVVAQLVKALEKAAEVNRKEAALARATVEKLVAAAKAADEVEATLRAEAAKLKELTATN